MRTLYLKVTTEAAVEKEWGMNPKFKVPHRLIQCSKLGVVKWNTASTYSDKEVVDLLIQGRPVVILK